MNKSKKPLPTAPQQPDPHITGKNRRSFLNRLWSFLGIIALIELVWMGGSILKRSKSPKATKVKDNFIAAGQAENFAANSVTAVPAGQFYLTRQGDGSFLALSRTCTHLGCSVPWDEKARKFICPCHGSSFDIAGRALTPPATRGLDSYPLRIENGTILVNIAKPEKMTDSNQPRSVQL